MEEPDRHRITDDFEELVSLDEQWDQWFEIWFGSWRTDRQHPVILADFKVDLHSVLSDKPGQELLDMVVKYEHSGLRAYKKLYIWSTDISDDAKQLRMNGFMNPPQAKSDEVLAEAIEKWDRFAEN